MLTRDKLDMLKTLVLATGEGDDPPLSQSAALDLIALAEGKGERHDA